jgi:hypothetical protein
MENNLEPNGKEEHQKGIMVPYSNAIIDPRAMMVKPLNALIANGTVPGSR